MDENLFPGLQGMEPVDPIEELEESVTQYLDPLIFYIGYVMGKGGVTDIGHMRRIEARWMYGYGYTKVVFGFEYDEIQSILLGLPNILSYTKPFEYSMGRGRPAADEAQCVERVIGERLRYIRFVNHWTSCHLCGHFRICEIHNGIEVCESCESRISVPDVAESYVYLVYSDSGHYKIGKASDPERRFSELTHTQGPFEYSLLHTIASDNAYQLERELHQRFAAKRFRGEWFELDNNDIQYILGL